jgi:hypothetical protein
MIGPAQRANRQRSASSEAVQVFQCRFTLTNGAINLGRLIKNNYTNIAQLKELTTIPPMTAERHAAIMRQRIAQRRMVEEAKELKLVSDPLFDSR